MMINPEMVLNSVNAGVIYFLSVFIIITTTELKLCPIGTLKNIMLIIYFLYFKNVHILTHIYII